MIKYSKFTDNIGSGNFTDTFCQNTDKFEKTGGGLHHPGGGVTPPHALLLDTPLGVAEYAYHGFADHPWLVGYC